MPKRYLKSPQIKKHRKIYSREARPSDAVERSEVCYTVMLTAMKIQIFILIQIWWFEFLHQSTFSSLQSMVSLDVCFGSLSCMKPCPVYSICIYDGLNSSINQPFPHCSPWSALMYVSDHCPAWNHVLYTVNAVIFAWLNLFAFGGTKTYSRVVKFALSRCSCHFGTANIFAGFWIPACAKYAKINVPRIFPLLQYSICIIHLYIPSVYDGLNSSINQPFPHCSPWSALMYVSDHCPAWNHVLYIPSVYSICIYDGLNSSINQPFPHCSPWAALMCVSGHCPGLFLS